MATRPLAGLQVLAVLLAAAACGAHPNARLTPTTANRAESGRPSVAAGPSVGAPGSCPARSGLPDTAVDMGAAIARGSRLTIEAGDSFFLPSCYLQIRARYVTLVVHNTGIMVHNVSIASQHIDRDVQPGQTIKVAVRLTGAHSLVFACKYHTDERMFGALVPAARIR